jgi:hypothetical protein
MPGVVAASLRKLHRRASLEGRGSGVTRAFRQIVEQLRQNPNDFGEPLFRLPALRLAVRTGSIRPLVVHFGVSEDHALVFIRLVRLLSAPNS